MVIDDDENESVETLEETQTPIQNETEISIADLELGVDQLKGVGAVTQKKLQTFGVTSLIDLCIRGAQEIKEITGVAKPTCDNWVFQSQKLLEDNNMIRRSDMSTVDLWEYQKSYPVIATKCIEVDNLIDGGVRPEATYEVYGEFGAGKTQFCNSLAVESIHDGNNVIWIDYRIAGILKAREYAENDEECIEYLNRITYLYCPNTEQLMGTINGLSKILDAKKPKLVILDGAIGQFREEYLGRGTLAERQMQIARLMSHIKIRYKVIQA